MELTVNLSKVKNNYETTFLVSPELSEADYKKLVSKFEKIIKDGEGEIINLENWGSRKLAYPIERHENAYYTLIEFKAPGPLVKKLEQEYLYEERILRYLTIKLDKDAVAYNIKRREKGFGSHNEESK